MADKKQLSILQRSINANNGMRLWNKWREKTDPDILDLSNANLEGANLTGANLSNAHLEEANLIGARIQFVNLFHAKLQEANLQYANFHSPFTPLYESTHDSSPHDYGETVLVGADLRFANLQGANLRDANLRFVNCEYADLREAFLVLANLREANFTNANLQGADLSGANLYSARFMNANINLANLSYANLSKAVMTGASLVGATLEKAILVEADLTGTNLNHSKVYGVSAWNIPLIGANQTGLLVGRDHEPSLTVDNLEMAQFIYMLLNNQNLRNVINTIATKAVLILGRFNNTQKPVLDALRDELRQHDYVPIILDFDPSVQRDLLETVSALAHMVRFIIADLTDPMSVPSELMKIIPDLSVPVLSLIQVGHPIFALFDSLRKYPWVLPTYEYENLEDLLAHLQDRVIAPAEAKAKELGR